jgi:hypothetical protein
MAYIKNAEENGENTSEMPHSFVSRRAGRYFQYKNQTKMQNSTVYQITCIICIAQSERSGFHLQSSLWYLWYDISPITTNSKSKPDAQDSQTPL